MIRFPALPAVILAVTGLTGCQMLKTPEQLPEDQKTTEEKQPGTVSLPGSIPDSLPDKKTATADQSASQPAKEASVEVRQQVIQTPSHINGKLVLGKSETGRLPGYDAELPAKIDTGAGRTSIDARNQHRFERDGKKWVRFELHRTSKGVLTLELPIKDVVLVRRPDGESQERPVVAMQVNIGDITQHLDVSLNDRANYDFPLLVGRDFLQDMAIADVGKNDIAVARPIKTLTSKVPESQVPANPEPITQPVSTNGLAMLGALEYVQIPFSKEPLKARIDTGAATSSLDARDIESFEKDGASWVRFKLVADGTETAIELPVTRVARIKRTGGLESQERQVVTMPIRIGSIEKPTEFTLRDRGDYEFPVLISELFLSDTAMVDVSQEYIATTPVRPARGNE